MGLAEFGSPKDLYQVCIRIPDRTHPSYSITNSPYEHCAHLRDFLEDMSTIGVKNIRLEDRMVPLATDDLRLLFNLNSLKRNLSDDVTTIEWTYLKPKESIWSDLLPVGNDEYRWWQVTTLTPDIIIDGYRLYSIEMNSKYDPARLKTRFDENSEFEFVFATAEEIELLKQVIK